MFSFRTLLALLLAVVSISSFATAYPITLTDIAHRHVTLTHEPRYIALSTGREFPLLEILYRQHAPKHLVAWRNDIQLSAPSMYKAYITHYPMLKTIPQIGLIKSGDFDLEKFINLTPKPDLFIVDNSNITIAEQKGILTKLAQADIPVLAVDFEQDPLHNTLPSVQLLAKATNREQQGQRFIDYYQQHLNKITSTLAHLPASTPYPHVFIERAAGFQAGCCNTFGNSNMGSFIPFLRAINVAEKPLKGAATGTMSAESLILTHPDIYIMQTTGWVNKQGQPSNGIPLGYGDIADTARRQATKALMDRPFVQATTAYQQQHIYAIYMPFYNSPYNLVAIEYFAKWLYPTQFTQLNPQHTFETLSQTIGGFPISGRFGQNNSEVVQ